MDINTQNSSGMMNGIPQVPQTEKKVGPIAGALIIVLILVIAALYFFGKKLNTDSVPVDTTTTQSASAVQADSTETLQADLNAQLEGVDYSF